MALRQYNLSITRDQRIVIKTTLLFKVLYQQIQSTLNVIIRQIFYTRNAPITPQKDKCGTKPLIRTPQRNALQQWLQSSSSRTRLPWRNIPAVASELDLQEVREKVMKTTFHTLNYVRRTFKKKGFSNDPRHMQARVEFARWEITWSRERLYDQIFSDEMWTMKRTHKSSYVTVQADETDRYAIHNVQHKYRKAPIWMFHDMLIIAYFIALFHSSIS
jgi:hypothetical protein